MPTPMTSRMPGTPALADLLLGDDLLDRAQPLAAELLRPGDPGQAALGELALPARRASRYSPSRCPLFAGASWRCSSSHARTLLAVLRLLGGVVEIHPAAPLADWSVSPGSYARHARGRAFTSAQAPAAAVVLARFARGRRRRPPLTRRSRAAGAGRRGQRRDPRARRGDAPRALPEAAARRPRRGGAARRRRPLGRRDGRGGRAGGARVVAGAQLPPGWVGKPWALHQGLGPRRASRRHPRRRHAPPPGARAGARGASRSPSGR